MKEYRRTRAALAEHSEQVFELLAVQLARLGSKAEWPMDDNFDTTEELARFAETIGLPAAGDQDWSALNSYQAAAAHLANDLT